MEMVTERLLHEEKKLSSGQSDHNTKAMAAKVKGPRILKGRCYYCDEAGHYKRFFPKLAEKSKYKSHSAVAEESDEEALVVGHAGMVGSSVSWIVDLGATCHMCNSRWQFVRYSNLLSQRKLLLEM